MDITKFIDYAELFIPGLYDIRVNKVVGELGDYLGA